ncbi:unnamed protein product [Cuscuta epithymum]|uniref:Uncharacterized protein n=1 Tax=Cuscuta epithymum TaxID=186058 RepID=A0AAV0EGR9_9ASTE|nr:unnamed protein product [Cuscuta epithymum]
MVPPFLEMEGRYIAMMEMCRIVGDRNRLIAILLLVSENVMNIILFHFQDSSYECDPTKSIKRLTYNSKPDTNNDELSFLCGKVISTMEKLGSLSEVFHFSSFQRRSLIQHRTRRRRQNFESSVDSVLERRSFSLPPPGLFDF